MRQLHPHGQIFHPRGHFVHVGEKKKTMDNNITVININNIVINGKENYKNGNFIPLFIDTLFWLVTSSHVSNPALRVLLYLLSQIDKHNQVTVDVNELVGNLNMKRRTIYNAIRDLKGMRILCKTSNNDNRKYQIKLYIINPRLAFYGNTRKINRRLAPEIRVPNGDEPLIP